MAKQRIISSEAQTKQEKAPISSIRPRCLQDYVGQRDLIERISITLEAVKQRGEPMEHVLLHGPPGLGKTTMAHIIAAEMGTRAFTTSGPALTKASDLVGTLTRLETNDVLFIDEIHRLPIAVEEYIYPAMEDFKIDVTVDSAHNAKTLTLQLKPFTLIGATTRAGLLSSPLRNRFGISHHLNFYNEDELLEILHSAAKSLNIETVSESALALVAKRSRGTPRVTLRLLRRIRDYAQVRADGKINEKVVAAALGLEGVDELGLDQLDRAYIKTLQRTYDGGPAGLEAIAASMGEDSGTLEDVVEPYLLQIGFLARTKQGRRLTPAATANKASSIVEPALFVDIPTQS